MFEDYSFWCAKNGFEMVKSAEFGKAVRAVFPLAKPGKVTEEGDERHRRRGYRGIKRADLSGLSGSN
jgi:hypothetical protein